MIGKETKQFSLNYYYFTREDRLSLADTRQVQYSTKFAKLTEIKPIWFNLIKNITTLIPASDQKTS